LILNNELPIIAALLYCNLPDPLQWIIYGNNRWYYYNNEY